MPNKKSNTSHQKPYQVYNLKGKSRMIILCDHASSYIPPKYKNLGLGKKEIRRHIGWDIGAALVAKKIAKSGKGPKEQHASMGCSIKWR